MQVGTATRPSAGAAIAGPADNELTKSGVHPVSVDAGAGRVDHDWVAGNAELAKPLPATVSVGADILRVVATLMVVTWHIFDGVLYQIRDFRTATGLALGSFFLLSGFVVRHSTVRKKSTFRMFWTARGGRLFSVLIPALLFTLGVQWLFANVNPVFYEKQLSDATSHPILRVLVQPIFASQIWGQDIKAFSNGPVWTLSYEGAAYVLYSCAFFFRGRARWAAVAAGALFYGPQILILFTCWAGGAVLHDVCQRHGTSIRGGLISLAIGASILVTTVAIDLPALIARTLTSMGWIDTWCRMLRHADEFPTFFASSLGFAFVIYGLNGIAPKTNGFFKRVAPPFLWVGSFCFSLYLFHYPILLLVKGLGGFDYSSLLGPAVSLVAALAGAYLLSFVSEARRKDWEKGIAIALAGCDRIYIGIAERLRPAPVAPHALLDGSGLIPEVRRGLAAQHSHRDQPPERTGQFSTKAADPDATCSERRESAS